MLINAGIALWLLRAYRLSWFSGRFGGGKTSLAYRFAAELMRKESYSLVTNGSCIWAEPDLSTVVLGEDRMLHTVFVLDEAGREFKDEDTIERIAAYAAKMDCIYIIPSVWPPHRIAQSLTMQPIFSFKSVGIPVIVYRWRVRLGGWEDHGNFLWAFPAEIHGCYSRQDPADTATDIVQHVAQQVENFRLGFGRKTRRKSLVMNEETGMYEEIFEDNEVSGVATDGGAVDRLSSLVAALRAANEDAYAALDERQAMADREAKLFRRRGRGRG